MSHREKLAAEKEVLGFYLTSHPLTELADRIARFATHTTKDLVELDDGTEVVLGGMISSIKRATTKKPSRNGHSKYVNFDFEDPQGVVRCIMWPEEFNRLGEKVVPEGMRFIKGKVDKRSREPNVVVDSMWTLEEVEKEFTKQVAIKFQRGLHDEKSLARVRDILRRHPGRSEVVLVVDTLDEAEPSTRLRYIMQTPNDYRVCCTPELKTALTDILGEGHLVLVAESRKNGHAASNSIGR